MSGKTLGFADLLTYLFTFFLRIRRVQLFDKSRCDTNSVCALRQSQRRAIRQVVEPKRTWKEWRNLEPWSEFSSEVDVWRKQKSANKTWTPVHSEAIDRRQNMRKAMISVTISVFFFGQWSICCLWLWYKQNSYGKIVQKELDSLL